MPAVQYEVVEGALRIDAANWAIPPSIEDSEGAMAIVIDKLLEAKDVSRVILVETRENEYDFEQTQMLREIAYAYDRILNQDRLLSIKNIESPGCEKHTPRRLADLQFLILEVLRKDPIGAYVRLNIMINAENRAAQTLGPDQDCHYHYLTNALEPMMAVIENTTLIRRAIPRLSEFKFGDRTLYREFFVPVIRPNFMLTRYMAMPPKDGKSLDKYYIGNTLVEIFQIPGKARYVYHITPQEFTLTEEQYSLLDQGRRYLAAHKPSEAEFTEPEKSREIFLNIGRDMLRDLSGGQGVRLSAEELENLATILTRYTAGFGILELLLADEKVQDIFINSPIGTTPVYIFHQDFEECETNLIPTREDAEAWATRFRLFSGRPLDEANPVLDTELIVPGGRARVAAITRSLSPEGLAYAFRRHREKPWTFPLFMQNKYIDPLFAGLNSFIVDGGRAMLIAGGRSSGKTSLLSSVMLEILKKHRIIVVEDSVTGDSQIVFERNGKMEKSTVGELIDGMMERHSFDNKLGRDVLVSNPEKVKVFAVGDDGKVKLSDVSKFVRHRVNKDIYEVETRTGRNLKVTGDHSLFWMGRGGSLEEVKAKNLRPGHRIAVPRVLPFSHLRLDKISIIENLEKLRGTFIFGEQIKKICVDRREEIKKIAKDLGYKPTRGHTYPIIIESWSRKGILPSGVLTRLLKSGCKLDPTKLRIKARAGSADLPTLIEMDSDFLSFLGLWLADGCYDRSSVLISMEDLNNESSSLVYRVAEKLGVNFDLHRDGHTIRIHSIVLKKVMRDILEMKGDAYTKEIPSWVSSLPDTQISALMRGLMSGDGYVAKSEIGISLCSRKMLTDLQTLLLRFSIIARISPQNKKDETYSCRISSLESIRAFSNSIGFIQANKSRLVYSMTLKSSTHDSTDLMPLSIFDTHRLSVSIPNFNSHDYLMRRNMLGRRKMQSLLESYRGEDLDDLKVSCNSDVFWDEVRLVKKIKNRGEYVYDFSVPDCENFVAGNILAHNTLELPIVEMRQLGYNIERLKSRSVITKVETELPPDEALRTALRLGDSVLIVGEVRSTESVALFEAMRIGALANVVAGTIHGESPYGVFDRVVNDLGVKPTSFKAIDIITVANMLRSPDGLHRFRRVVEMTEVRKKWKNDPEDEGGFVPLMEYSAKEDRLKPTDTLTDGESEVLNEIAKRVRDWRGAWDLVWDNILLRTKVKQAMVDYAGQLQRPEILESDWSVDSNEVFHIISDQVRQEVGGLDSKMIYERWLEWFKTRLK